MLFADRAEAGRKLAERLTKYRDRDDTLVLALPRGGVPVGFEVASALHLPMDVFLVRKLGVPEQEELAMGAIASGGVRVLNDEILKYGQIPPHVVNAVTARERHELQRREKLYRGDRPLPDVAGRTVILVDDGLATGASMQAAIQALRHLKPARIVVAVPVGARETCAEFRQVADEVICASTPEPFRAVGLWYADFSATTDDEVQTLLARARDETEVPTAV